MATGGPGRRLGGGSAARTGTANLPLHYGRAPSFRDPVRYSFAHGGKDGHPYPVDRSNYDRSIATLEQALRRARLGDREKLAAPRRLASWGEETRPST
jgi:hypothetical protein